MHGTFKSGNSETESEELGSIRLKEEMAEELLHVFSKPVARDELRQEDVGQIWKDLDITLSIHRSH